MSSCSGKIPDIGLNQPNFMFWSDLRNEGCRGTQMSLPPGNYNLIDGVNRSDDYRNKFGSVIGYDDIDAIYVPPNGRIVAHNNGWGGNEATFTSNESNIGYPGLYNNLDDANRGIGNNDIDSFLLTTTKPWKQHLQECCTGNNIGVQCGNFKQGAAVCNNEAVFNTCSADDIKSSANPSLKQQYCMHRAMSNTQLSDMLKTQYCNANPTHPWCSCIKLESTPDYQSWAAAFGKKYPQLSVNKLAYVDDQGRNTCRSDTTDLVDIFLTEQIKADRNNLPKTISIQDLTITGNNNVVDNKMEHTENTGSSAETKQPTAEPQLSMIAGISDEHLKYLIVIIVILVGGYYFMQDDTPNLYGATNMQPNMQPNMEQANNQMEPIPYPVEQ